MKAFFFGAGSSYGTLEHFGALAPTATKFGEFLSKQSGFPERYKNLRSAARHVEKDLAQIGLEDLWTCLDYYAKLSGDRNYALDVTPDWLCPAVKELKREALLWLYGKQCDAAADALPDSDDYTLGDILKNQVGPGDVAISFNYDTVVERLLKRFGRKLLHCCGRPRDFVKFAKPHGSASWPLNVDLSVVIEGDPLLDSLAADMNHDPLVLGAVPIKSELLREIQQHYGVPQVFEVVMHQWRSVVEAVRDAEELVVVGYSFPKEDQYGRFLFQEGMRMRKQPLNRIEFYNRSASNGGAILDVFGRENTKVVWKGPVTAPSLSI